MKPSFIQQFCVAEPRVEDWTEDMDLRINKGISVGIQRKFLNPGQSHSAE